MNKSVIEVKNIYKKYRITHQREKYLAFRDVLVDKIKKPFKKKEGTKEDFWALKDISFEVKQGEAMGIIGPNGAGKTTLLKVLSRITPPNSGEITINGRVASLLEVGTGFHPELTGRENIFFNGSILGMKNVEIKRKFDDIVEFSGVEKFLDTPVKRYSSGMFVRLAFSVAAYLESEILLVDEVLAVGDAEFQKKCLGKMDDITKRSGRTILFVSHNMAAVQNLCNRCVFLKAGEIKAIGETKDVVEKYLATSSVGNFKKTFEDYKQDDQRLRLISIELKNGLQNKFCVNWGQPIELIMDVEAREPIKQVCFAVGLNTIENVPLFTIRNSDANNDLWNLSPGRHKLIVSIENPFMAGIYNTYLTASSISRKNILFHIPNANQLEISNITKNNKKYPYQNNGVVNVEANWQLID